MFRFKKKNLNADSFGILLLIGLTIFAGYMGCSKRFLKEVNEEKVTTSSKNYSGNSYSDYNYDYDYDYDYDDEYYNNYDDYYWNYDYDYNHNYGSSYSYNNNDDYDYNYTGYKNYDDNYYNYYNNYYNDTNKPAIQYTTKDIVDQYEEYDPWKNVSASHQRFGDVTDIIEIIYNDLDVNVPGEYSIVYKACNYPGSVYCRTATRKVVVNPEEESYYDDTKAPVWSKTSNKTCYEGDRSCKTSNLTEPTATDPYSDRKLDVTLIDGDVDIYTPDTYVLVYYAETESGISGTTTRIVTIESKDYDDYDYGYSDYDDYYDDYNYQQRKYISNHYSSYYDDGTYRGLLTINYNDFVSKYIQDYKWTNVVYYTFKCDNEGEYGRNGWSHVSTDTSDNHPTYEYNVGGFSGTLNKVTNYCVPGQGCEEDVSRQLGICENVGEQKQITRAFVGVYSGYVYANEAPTYSGYVYRYR